MVGYEKTSAMKKYILILIVLCGRHLFASSQEGVVVNYINEFSPTAVIEGVRTGIPPSITLAQGIHESGNGKSELARKSNNHFGIKCGGSWNGRSVNHDDDKPNECFRKYDSPLESYKDHSDFLTSRKHYARLFQLPITDYKAWAYGLKKAGYATDPKYPQKIIKNIEKYNLFVYDRLAIGLMMTYSYLKKLGYMPEYKSPQGLSIAMEKYASMITKL
jgi:flagellum-specific peptidoglycan hydrolase FlgJ